MERYGRTYAWISSIALITLVVFAFWSFQPGTIVHASGLHNDVDLTYHSGTDNYTGDASSDDNYFYTEYTPTYASNNDTIENNAYFLNQCSGCEEEIFRYDISVDPDYFSFNSYYEASSTCVAPIDSLSSQYESDGDLHYTFYFGDAVGGDVSYYGDCSQSYTDWTWVGGSSVYYWKNLENPWYSYSLLFYSGWRDPGNYNLLYPEFETTDTVTIN